MKFMETNWRRYLKQLSNFGFVVLSACKEVPEDKENTLELKNTIKNSKFAFKPVDGAYAYSTPENAGIGRSKEDSFLVAAYDKRAKKQADFQELYDFAIKLGEKYNQESVLICKPHENPSYYYPESGTSDKPFNKVSFDDFNARFGTADTKGDYFDNVDNKKLGKIKRSFTMYNGKRPVSVKDPEDVWEIDYTDEEKEEAKKKGIDLDKENAFLEAKKSGDKKRMFEAIFVANHCGLNGGFQPVNERDPNEEYKLINEWIAERMGIVSDKSLREGKTKLKEMDLGWIVQVKLSNGEWLQPETIKEKFNTKEEAEKVAKAKIKREFRVVELKDKSKK